jgi:hypothetical protein
MMLLLLTCLLDFISSALNISSTYLWILEKAVTLLLKPVVFFFINNAIVTFRSDYFAS